MQNATETDEDFTQVSSLNKYFIVNENKYIFLK